MLYIYMHRQVRLVASICAHCPSSIYDVQLQLDLERHAGRGFEDLRLGKRLRQQGLEELRRPLFGEHGCQESAGVDVAVAHGYHVPGSQQPGQVDGVLLAGDEGEVGWKELLHHRRDHHVRPQTCRACRQCGS